MEENEGKQIFGFNFDEFDVKDSKSPELDASVILE